MLNISSAPSLQPTHVLQPPSQARLSPAVTTPIQVSAAINARHRRSDSADHPNNTGPSPIKGAGPWMSETQLEAEAHARIFEQKIYGPFMANTLSHWKYRNSLVEIEQSLLKPLHLSGLFDIRIDDMLTTGLDRIEEQRSIGDMSAKVLLRAHGLGDPHYSQAAVAAMIRLVKHLGAHVPPLSPTGSPNAVRDSTLLKWVRITDFISNLSLPPEQLVQLAEQISHIDNRQILLNKDVLLMLGRNAAHSESIVQLLNALAPVNREPREPFALSKEDGELLSFLLAREPRLAGPRLEEIKACIEEKNLSAKIVRYLALLATPSITNGLALSPSGQYAADTPLPYRAIWQFLEAESNPKQIAPGKLEEFINRLVALAPPAHQAGVKAAYIKMAGLGLLTKVYFLALPLLRPELSRELTASELLNKLAASDSEQSIAAFIEYVEASSRRPTPILTLYSLLEPSKTAYTAEFRADLIKRLYGLEQPEGIERLYALYQQTGAPVLNFIDEKRDFLALEVIKAELEDAIRNHLTPLAARIQSERPVLGDSIWAVKSVRSMRRVLKLYPLQGWNAKALLQMLRAEIRDDNVIARAASLTTIEQLVIACKLLARNPKSRLDAETLQALRQAGNRAPALASVLAMLPPDRYRALVKTKAVQQFVSLLPPGFRWETRPLDFERFCREFANVWTVNPVFSQTPDGLSRIRQYLHEKNSSKKLLFYMALVVNPQDGASIKLPIASVAGQTALPYRRLLPDVPPEGSLQSVLLHSNQLRDDYLNRLAQFVAPQYQSQVQKAYQTMRALGIISPDKLDYLYLALPMVRPELAEQFAESTLLKEIQAFETKKRGWYLDEANHENKIPQQVLGYIDAALKPDWKWQAPQRLTPDISVERLYALHYPNARGKSDTDPQTKRELLALEALKFSLSSVQHQLLTSDQESVQGERMHALIFPLEDLSVLGSLPAVKAFRNICHHLKQGAPTLNEAQAILAALQPLLEGPSHPTDSTEHLTLIERRCSALQTLLATQKPRLSPAVIRSVTQAGLYAPAFAHWINALPAPLYDLLLQQNAFSIVLMAFRRRFLALPIETRDALLTVSSVALEPSRTQTLGPDLERFMQDVEQCVSEIDPKKRLKAWMTQMVWTPPESQERAQRVLDFLFPTSRHPSHWWTTRALRAHLKALPLSKPARDQMILLWLSVPELTEPLAALLVQRSANPSLDETVQTLANLIPGVRDDAASRSALAEQLQISPSVLAEQLSHPPAETPLRPGPLPLTSTFTPRDASVFPELPPTQRPRSPSPPLTLRNAPSESVPLIDLITRPYPPPPPGSASALPGVGRTSAPRRASGGRRPRQAL